ncbi:MAG: DUF3422 domain-containing protein [Rhodoferax sp.]
MIFSPDPNTPRWLPADDPDRVALHNEVHARPTARIRLPALLTYVAVLHAGVSRHDEAQHLNRLAQHVGLAPLTEADLHASYLRWRAPGFSLKWERHSEFTRYVIVQPLPPHAGLQAQEPDLLRDLAVPQDWLARIPGRTVAAVHLAMLNAPLDDATALMAQGMAWLGARTVVASLMGSNAARVEPPAALRGYNHPQGHSWVLTQFRLQPDGFERMLVLAPEGTSETRAGRIAARLLDIETYRLMALRGLPVAKALAPLLAEVEADLLRITTQLEDHSATDAALLESLVALAGRIERATAQSAYRFAATQAYDALVQQRLRELREQAIPGTQTLGEFMQRRQSPAVATVQATARRLADLSQRVARSSDLLRTRVDIATEAQNQQLLEKLTRGQALQLRLQSTVEGLSIAAISYYVVSLLLYAGKAAKASGLPINPELAAGASIPLVLWGVWRTVQRIHAKLHPITE